MDKLLYLTVIIPAILIVVGMLIAFILLKNKKAPRYLSLFIMGFIWFPFGIIFLQSNYPIGFTFFALGLIYLVIGFTNRDKWMRVK